MPFNPLACHNQRRIVGEVICIMLVGVWGVGRGVEVLEEGFEIWVEVQLGGFGVVLAHVDGFVLSTRL